jgi:integrase
MSSTIRQRSPQAFQLIVKHKLLPKPFVHTFDDNGQAQAYRDNLVMLLKRGIVPQDLMAEPKETRADDPLLVEVISEYERTAPIAPSDFDQLKQLRSETLGIRLSGLTFEWVEGFVVKLKSPQKHLSPGTIRKRVESLGRAVDWKIRRTTKKNEIPRANPLRLLPKNYSVYSGIDAKLAAPKLDVSKNLRLGPGQHEAILKVLQGYKRPDRERALEVDPAFELMYKLTVSTGMRLFEVYRLQVSSIDFDNWVINCEGSKGHRGKIKPRVIPLIRELRELLTTWCKDRIGLVFPYWDGSLESRKKTQLRLTSRYKTLFSYAGINNGFTEHDLRHEAACRWFTMRNQQNSGWMFSDTEVCRIMGWSDMQMALRYASLRGEDLSARLG